MPCTPAAKTEGGGGGWKMLRKKEGLWGGLAGFWGGIRGVIDVLIT